MFDPNTIANGMETSNVTKNTLFLHHSKPPAQIQRGGGGGRGVFYIFGPKLGNIDLRLWEH